MTGCGCSHPPRECDPTYSAWGLALWLAAHGWHGDAKECMDWFVDLGLSGLCQ